MKIPQKHADCGCKKRQLTNINRHKVAVSKRVHVLQHVTFIKQCILQTQFTEHTAVVIVSDGHVISVKQIKQAI